MSTEPASPSQGNNGVQAPNKAIAAFVKAQGAFGPALKTGTGNYGKYASLDVCVEAVMGALHDNDLGLMQKTHESEKGVAVETLFLHTSGDILSGGILHLPAAKLTPQDFGSALTYCRRYSLLAACGIAPEDDDGQSAQNSYNARKPEKPATGKLPDGSYQMAPAPKTSPVGNPGAVAGPWREVSCPAFVGDRLKGLKLGELEQVDLTQLYEEFGWGGKPSTPQGKRFKDAILAWKEESDDIP